MTTHGERFQDDLFPENLTNPAAKEILRYRQALRVGYDQVHQSGLLSANHINASSTTACLTPNEYL